MFHHMPLVAILEMAASYFKNAHHLELAQTFGRGMGDKSII